MSQFDALKFLSDDEFRSYYDRIIESYPQMMLDCCSKVEENELIELMIRILTTQDINILNTKTIILFYSKFVKSLNNDLIRLIRENHNLDIICLQKSIDTTLNLFKKWEKSWGKSRLAVNITQASDLVCFLLGTLQIWPTHCDLLKRVTDYLLFLYQSASKPTDTNTDAAIDSDADTEKKALKLTILEFLDSLLKLKWCDNLKDEENIAGFCSWVLPLIEVSHATGTVELFKDAPLLLDYEITYGISNYLRGFCYEHIGQELDTERVDLIIESLDNLVVFSGNAHLRKLISPVAAAPQLPRRYSAIDEAVILSVSKVQDLFPDLGLGFIETCLKEFGNDSETLIMKILEDSLPDHLAGLNRQMASLNGTFDTASDTTSLDVNIDAIDNSTPTKESILDSRKNIFDGDKFDVFNNKDFDVTNVYSKQSGETFKNIEVSNEEQKQMVVNAMVAQELADEDEFDDTYEEQDIVRKGVSAVPGEDGDIEQPTRAFVDVNEKHLVEIYQSDPSIFHSSMRKSPKRMELERHLKWSPEQIEGWYSQLLRNPNRLARLLEKYEWRGNHQQEETQVIQESPQPMQKKFVSTSNRGSKKSKRGQRIHNPGTE